MWLILFESNRHAYSALFFCLPLLCIKLFLFLTVLFQSHYLWGLFCELCSLTKVISVITLLQMFTGT